MVARVFVDGGAGTTGIEIVDRLAGHSDIEMILLAEDRRKDPAARADALAAADVAILCLPDDAAREAVKMAKDLPTRFIDASTANRIADGWTYGFAELEPGRRAELAAARFVTNPGCYPTGFLALTRPLIREGLLPADALLSVSAASGYSGGGKTMIADYERGAAPSAFAPYGLALAHKHVPEMRHHAGLNHAPIFAPSVANAYRGMIVEVPLHRAQLAGDATIGQVRAALADAYTGSPLVSVVSADETRSITTLSLEHTASTDRLVLFVFASSTSDQFRLVATLDNLGKGASGAAVQNLNLMLGLPETEGLRL